jgi:hypothetical protein
MPILQILITWLFLVIIVLTLAGLTVLGFIAFLKGWTPVLWGSIIAAIGIVSAVVCAVLLMGFVDVWYKGEFPFLRTPPIERDLPGLYVLDKGTAHMLSQKGYTNLSAKILLKNDKTFEISEMPHLWLYGSDYRAGYDSCVGTWRIEKPRTGTSVYSVTAWISNYSTNSAFLKDTGKGFGGLGFVHLGIADKTTKRPDYALAVELNVGDEGYLFFVKSETAR